MSKIIKSLYFICIIFFLIFWASTGKWDEFVSESLRCWSSLNLIIIIIPIPIRCSPRSFTLLIPPIPQISPQPQPMLIKRNIPIHFQQSPKRTHPSQPLLDHRLKFKKFQTKQQQAK